MITVIHKSDIVKNIPLRWELQYRGGASDEQREITQKLKALVWPFTAEQVNEIIGNNSWTTLECDECGFDFETLVRVGVEPDYEARWQDLCKSCLHKALEAL